MGAKGRTPNIDTEAVPVEDESLLTHQEAVPVPLWWGKQKIAGRAISPATEQLAIEATDRPEKK
jgi:hypothetical protein